MTSVGSVTVSLLGDASGALSALDSVTTGLGKVSEIAAGIAIGEAFISSVETAISALEDLFNEMMQVNVAVEQFTVTTGVLLQNAMNGMGQMSSSATSTAATTSKAADTIASAQQRMADAAQNHAIALQRIQQEAEKAQQTLSATLMKLATDYQQSLTAIGDAEAKATDTANQQEQLATDQFNVQLATRTRSYDEAMASLDFSHQKTLDSIAQSEEALTLKLQDEIAKLTDSYQAAAEKQQAAFATALDQAPDSYEKQRKSAAATMKSLQADLVDARRSGDGDLVAALERRIAEEQGIQNESYDQYVANLQAQQNAAKAAALEKYNDQVAQYQQQAALQRQSLQQRLADENASYAMRKANLEQNYAADVGNLHAALTTKQNDTKSRLADEIASYQEQVAKKKQTYDQDVANAKQAEADKLAALQQRVDDENRILARANRDAQESIAKASRPASTSSLAGQKAARFAGPPINELPEQQKQLEQLFGTKITSGEQEAQLLDAYILQHTLGTPFTSEQLRGASQMLTGYRLSTVGHLKDVTDLAAATGMAPDYAAQLMGQISTGIGGFAIRELGRKGLPLETILPKGFFNPSTNMLMKPPSEVMPLVFQAIEEKFGGVAAKQTNTVPGLISNLKDFAIMFAGVSGGTMPKGAITGKGSLTFPTPEGVGIYADIENHLRGIYEWLSKNTDSIAKFADSINKNLVRAWSALEPHLAKVEAAIETWLTSGQAEKDFTSLTDSVIKLVPEIANLVPKVEKFVQDAIQVYDTLQKVAGVFELVTGLSYSFYVIPIIWGTVTDFFNNTLPPLQAQFNQVFGQILDTVSKDIASIKGTGEKDFATLRDTLGTIWNTIETNTQGTWFAIVNFFTVQIPRFAKQVQDQFNGIRDSIKLAFLEAQLGIEDTMNAILSFIEDFVNSVIDRINSLISGMLGGINSVLQAAKQAPINFTPIQHLNMPLLDTSGAQNAVNAMQGQVNVTVNVQGNVMTEQDLVSSVRQGLIQTGLRNGGSIFNGMS